MKNHDDYNLGNSSLPDSIDSFLRQPTQIPVLRESFSRQITYLSSLFSKSDSQDKESLSEQDQKFANHANTRAAKSHQDIVRVLFILRSYLDNKGPDEVTCLKKAMTRHD